ncbi:hypothetical protein [Pseudophaeobacter sp.]|jgi:hypothetical protein|uniref:hypothetical protein n=1 Tax=Pseudophaeobacter sp. TaxID=1971739 RepID=UPI0025F37B15|nr:hypothetical protein [uncultured Pseudophaeobacter sp.]
MAKSVIGYALFQPLDDAGYKLQRQQGGSDQDHQFCGPCGHGKIANCPDKFIAGDRLYQDWPMGIDNCRNHETPKQVKEELHP